MSCFIHIFDTPYYIFLKMRVAKKQIVFLLELFKSEPQSVHFQSDTNTVKSLVPI